MKCFYVPTFSEEQKIHTLSSHTSFGLFERHVSQQIWWELVLNWVVRILALQEILASMYDFVEMKWNENLTSTRLEIVYGTTNFLAFCLCNSIPLLFKLTMSWLNLLTVPSLKRQCQCNDVFESITFQNEIFSWFHCPWSAKGTHPFFPSFFRSFPPTSVAPKFIRVSS